MSAEESRVGTTFGKYQITGLLGRGGMGEVYEAHDNEIGRTVALKIIKSQFANDRGYRMRFERESHATAKLQEPHVIPIHGFGEIDGCLFIDMRLVRGTDLQSLIDRGPLDPTRAVAIVTQVAAALDAAHAENLIHRDVKPQNIIVTPADFAYLVDFGIAETMGDTRLTVAGTQIGSWAYMAPERFGGHEITPAVDIYALTCVLYEALSGQMPFQVQSPEAVIAAHLSSPPPRPSISNPKVPPPFDDVIARGMAKEPDDRYGSAGAVARAANRALQSGSRTSVGPSEYAPTQYSPDSAPTQYASWPPLPRPQSGPQVSAPFPPARPGPVSYPAKPSQRPRWLVPTVIAVSVAVVLGAIGIIIGLLAKLNSPAPTAAPSTPTTFSGFSGPTTSEEQSSQSTSVSTPPVASMPPPLVTGPDQSGSHAVCDQGFQFPNATGFGTQAGRGTPQTSCYFAHSVLLAYWNTYGNASPAARTVSAPGYVACSTVPGANCDPKNTTNFLMQCAGDGSNPWIKCTGGADAIVYLW